MKTSIEISQGATLRPIEDIASMVGLTAADIQPYGKYKCKIPLASLKNRNLKRHGRLIVVTAMSPTPFGEGKTTTAIGLSEAFWKLEKRSIACVRQPSLGPIFGVKGGATGGGYAQAVPMEEINLHFTGDIHAIASAHNLLSAVIDNHLYQGNILNIDPSKVRWKRTVDMNDRALRNVKIGLGGKTGGVPREDGFEITAASEIMAVLCLSRSIIELKARLGRVQVALRKDGTYVTAADLNVHGATAILLRDALNPNLVQTLENTPVIIHGGPFGNIAHGCPSVVAVDSALKLADYVAMEPGFGSDLGAEKFFDIVCPQYDFKPDLAVVVASIRALKFHGGVPREQLSREDVQAVGRGLVNLDRHWKNMAKFGVPAIVTLNRFEGDRESEVEVVAKHCQQEQIPFAVSNLFTRGGNGGVQLAELCLRTMEERHSRFTPLYEGHLPLKEKIEKVAREIYGARDVRYSQEADEQIKKLEINGPVNLPVCIAKTQYSFSDDPNVVGCPSGFDITVRRISVSAGAGFIVAFAGEILTMPGLPKQPAAEQMDIDENGLITGLF